VRGLHAQISLSDETDYAISFCIVESRPVAHAVLPARGDDAAESASTLHPS
jgi:hypothetical protein